ncbi:SusD/RagB family nutrient-binding outer membrane lipoprotein [Salegentibacter sp. Hel_I_6]|uniref:SusD/RagB family nutrient-binding outer membrane lipoprotein n=1 Tax=Salegentibacter sp. Hel_I_6 TaxID=1250278 RepID=UPI00056ABCC6|nr:SusD/RagB family nutrient-binding outer membrane lipoprotein [Salegentibacter sp. Hel_I_6]
MKKYILTFIALATLWSCQTDEQYEDLNRDPKNPTDVAADFLFTSATKDLARQMASPNVNINIFRFISQYWTTTTYLDEPNYNINNRNIPQNHWNRLYRWSIFNLMDAKEKVQEEALLSDAEKTTRIAQIEVLEIYTWQVLVDTFGDIPYTEALGGADNISPAYDDAETIYNDLISRISTASANLSAGQGFAGATDLLYNGDMGKWEKFANSLQLRLAMQVSDVNPSLAQTNAEEAYSNGVFESNADNALLPFQSAPPNTNPLWEDLVQSGRSDYVSANTVVDVLNELDDPRRSAYLDTNLGEDTYVGGVYGASNSFQNFTHVGDPFRDPTNPGILMDYAEVRFLLADAAQNGFAVGGSAEEHYEAAITASMEYWNVAEGEIEDYLSDGDVAYDGSEDQLATQFWLAMYDNPFQGWNVWRRFDAPEFNLPASTGNDVPVRYTYPINEQNLNEANWSAASDAIGGDEQGTNIFWDVE